MTAKIAALQSSNTDIVGKDSNKYIANSSLPAITLDLEYTGSEVTSRWNSIALGGKSSIVPFICMAGRKKQEDKWKSNEAQERIFLNEWTENVTVQKSFSLSFSSREPFQCG